MVNRSVFALVLVSAMVFSNISRARAYSCRDLPRLRSQITKNSRQESSVAATIIRYMGRYPNPCVETVKDLSNAAEVIYWDQTNIKSDIFNFSKNNRLVSTARTYLNGKTKIINF